MKRWPQALAIQIETIGFVIFALFLSKLILLRFPLAWWGRAPARSGFQRAGEVSFGVGVPCRCLIRQEKEKGSHGGHGGHGVFGRGRCFFAFRESAKHALKSASND